VDIFCEQWKYVAKLKYSQEITFSGRLQRVDRCVRMPHHAQFPSPRKKLSDKYSINEVQYKK
jgi:hypothetical protein